MKYAREQIAETPAGRELDAVIEESLFGRKVTRNWPCMINGDDGSMMPQIKSFETGAGYEHKEPTIGRGYNREVIPRYSTEIAAAWPIMEKMLNEWPDCGLHRGTDEASKLTRVYWGFDGHGWIWADAATAPLAICRAALLAKL